MPASSQASSELSTASLIVVRRAFEGLSKPSRWRFLTKNSETEISRCFVRERLGGDALGGLGLRLRRGGLLGRELGPRVLGLPGGRRGLLRRGLGRGRRPFARRDRAVGRLALPFFFAALRLRHCLSLSPRPRQTRQSSIARGGDGAGPAAGDATLGQAGAPPRGQAAVAEDGARVDTAGGAALIGGAAFRASLARLKDLPGARRSRGLGRRDGERRATARPARAATRRRAARRPAACPGSSSPQALRGPGHLPVDEPGALEPAQRHRDRRLVERLTAGEARPLGDVGSRAVAVALAPDGGGRLSQAVGPVSAGVVHDRLGADRADDERWFPRRGWHWRKDGTTPGRTARGLDGGRGGPARIECGDVGGAARSARASGRVAGLVSRVEPCHGPPGRPAAASLRASTPAIRVYARAFGADLAEAALPPESYAVVQRLLHAPPPRGRAPGRGRARASSSRRPTRG